MICKRKRDARLKINHLFASIATQLEKLAEKEASKERIAWFQQQHKQSKLKCYGSKRHK